MVSFPVPAPVTKSVDDAVAVQEALSRARLSTTSTFPSTPVIVDPGAPEPRFAAAGAVIESAPLVTVKVIVVSGSPATGPTVVLMPDPAAAGPGPARWRAVAADAETG